MTTTTRRLHPVTAPQLPELPISPARRVKRARTYSPIGAIGRRMRAAQQLQLQIQELEAKLADHRAWFLSHMEQNNLTSLELGMFSVSMRTRHRWKYTPETEADMQRLQVTQKWEQSRGEATDDPTYYVALSTKPLKTDMQ